MWRVSPNHFLPPPVISLFKAGTRLAVGWVGKFLLRKPERNLNQPPFARELMAPSPDCRPPWGLWTHDIPRLQASLKTMFSGESSSFCKSRPVPAHPLRSSRPCMHQEVACNDRRRWASPNISSENFMCIAAVFPWQSSVAASVYGGGLFSQSCHKT